VEHDESVRVCRGRGENEGCWVSPRFKPIKQERGKALWLIVF
jgi:hypothetical protein